MKRLSKIMLLASLGLASATFATFAQDGPSGGPEARAATNAPHHRPGPAMLLNLLDKYDVNKDGQLDKDEMAALRKDIQNGKLPRPEGAPGQARMGGPRHGNGDSAGGPEFEHDGKAPKGEAGVGQHQPPTPEKLIAKFDTDKDGKLDAAELGALLKDLREHQDRMLAHRGPGGRDAHKGPPFHDGPPADDRGQE